MIKYEEVFESTKESLIEVLKKTTLNDYSLKQESISAHLEFIVSLKKMADCNKIINSELIIDEQPVEFIKNEENSLQVIESICNPEKELLEGFELINNETEISSSLTSVDDHGRMIYLFERKLEGGFLSAINAFVSEGTLRKLEVKHHDYLYAREIEPLDDRKRYVYSFAKRGDLSDPIARVQISYCLIELLEGKLIVRKSLESTSNNFFVNSGEFTFTLQERDIERLSLKEGDLVDIAFYENHMDTHKVIWVHRFEEKKERKFEGVIQKVAKDKIVAPIEEKEVLEQTLKEKTILVIGNEPKKSFYEQEVIKRGGTFLWADAKADLTRLRSLVRKSDNVVFLLKVSGHTGMKQIKKYCKERNIPFLTTWSLSGTTIADVSGEQAITNG
jgi:hypothetical protein